MAKATKTDQWVLLPPSGLHARGRGVSADAIAFFRSAGTGASTASVSGRQVPMRVLDSIGEDGAKLVELPPESRLAIRSMLPSVRVVPVVFYSPALAPVVQVHTRAARSGMRAPTITLRVVSRADRRPIAKALVVALVDVGDRIGAQGMTDRQGRVKLALGSSSVKLEGLYVYPAGGYWSLRQRNLTVSSSTEVALPLLDLGFVDAVRHFYGGADLRTGRGVTVGVLDTGIAEHPDLVIDGGMNAVTGENPDDFGDNGAGGHGTHVAGIIAARGEAPSGVRGVAPGVRLRSYRVFPRNSGSASSFVIAKAVDQAVADRCDLLNLSLGGGSPDPVLTAAVDDARAAGSLCIIAAGNDGRQPVSFPGLLGSALAISAMGRRGTFPPDAPENEDIAPPFGTDRRNFVAAFSNIGPEIDLTGPGVAIISTVPGGHAVFSGTSMACPAVVGAAAKALATSGLIRRRRNAARSDAMVKAVLSTAESLGFGPNFEGHGLPQPE